MSEFGVIVRQNVNTYEYFFVGVKIVMWLAISNDLIYIDVHTTVVGPIRILGIGLFSCQREETHQLFVLEEGIINIFNSKGMP